MTQLTAQEQNLLAQITAAVRQVVREELEAAKPTAKPVEAPVVVEGLVAVVAEQPIAVEPVSTAAVEQPAPVVVEGKTTGRPKWYLGKKKVKSGKLAP